MEIKNAQITRTMLGREDHGIMTFMVFVRFSCCECGIGGYALDCYDRSKEQRVFSSKGMESISKLLETVGVETWEDLTGKFIRIKDNGLSSSIDEIGNLMEEKWFNLKKFFNQVQPNSAQTREGKSS